MDIKPKNKMFPFDIQELDPETNAAISGVYENASSCAVSVGPKRYIMSKNYKDYASTLYNYTPKQNQVFVSGYPRSGTTWVQQLVWLMVNDLDYATCDSIYMEDIFPLFEIQSLFSQQLLHKLTEANKHNENNLKKLKSVFKEPLKHAYTHDMLKTHLPLSLLAPKFLDTSKMVYVARDPRDVLLSKYHVTKDGFGRHNKELKSMLKNFINGNMEYCPYFEHVKEAWNQRQHPNMLFIFYEDILNDQLATLRRVAEFFNKSYTEEQLISLQDYLHINNLKKKKTYNREYLKEVGLMKPDGQFIRTGKSGIWRQHFDEEMSREAEVWIEENLRGTDLRFPSMSQEYDRKNK